MARRLSGAALLADLEAAERTGLKTKAERDYAKQYQQKVNSTNIPHNRGLGSAGKQSKNDTRPERTEYYSRKGKKYTRPNGKKHPMSVAQNEGYNLARRQGASYREARAAVGLPTG